MEAMPPIDYAQLATKQDLNALDAKLTGEMTGLRGELSGEMAELRAEVRGNMAGLEAKVDSGFARVSGDFAELRGEMAELRGDLKSDIAGNLRYMVAAQITTMMMLAAWITAVS